MDYIKLREAVSLNYDRQLERIVLNKVGAVLEQNFPDVVIDEGKLKEWFLQENSLHVKAEQQACIDLYKSFRRELDEMCIPLIINDLPRIMPIEADGEIVGMVAGDDNYIDCVYVKPEHRKKGLARKAVLKFVRGRINEIKLRIINNNKVAHSFWNNIFELQELDVNSVDTLYVIVKIKQR